MRVLGVDSASITGACAVWEDGCVLCEGFVNNGLTHSQTLLPMIADTLQKAGISLESVSRFAVTIGPGSFTGLRIGMATVKGLAAPRETPCAGVSTLHALAYGAGAFDGILCPVMDARCGQVYNALFRVQDGVCVRLCEDRAIAAEDLLQQLCAAGEPVLLVGDGAQLCARLWDGRLPGLTLADEAARYLHGGAVAALGAAAQPTDAEALMPVYLRLPQAERELKAKRNKD